MEQAGHERQAGWQLSDEQLAAALVSSESRLRRDYADMLSLVAEAHSRGVSAALGYRDLRTLMSETLRISAHQARVRLEQAEAILPTTSPLGAQVAPPMPATGAAVAAAELNAEHVAELCKIMQQVSGKVDADSYAQAEADLVELARHSVPAALRTAGRHLLRYLDQDGAPPTDDDPGEAQPHRRFRSHYKRNRWLAFDGELDPETASLLDGLFGTLARPEPADPSGQPDPRGTMQREGDALAEIINLAARADELPTQGGERATLTVTVPLEVLEDRARAALLELPEGMSPAALRRLACDAKIVPAVLGTRGEVLDVGRAARHATTAQRHALALRDRGCAHPGCGRTPKWTTPHHIRNWADGGTTTLDNLVLLCGKHHRLIHHSHWQVRIHNGHPEFLPPQWLDPAQQPLHNHAHDPPRRQADRRLSLSDASARAAPGRLRRTSTNEPCPRRDSTLVPSP